MQSPAEEQNTVQFTVMVIPYAKEGEDVKSLIQADPNRRIAASVVKTEFDKRGFTTYNYEELVNNLKTQDILDADNQTSLEQEIIKNSPSDIVLKVDYIQTKDANGNMVEILLEAIDSFTGQSLANGRGRSRIMNTDKFTLLSEQAAVESIGDFLDLLNSKFAAMHEKGRSIQLNFLLSEDAEYNMDSRVGEKSTPLKFIIRKWLREQSFKGYYHIKGGSQTSLSVDDFRIPVKDENGNNYQIDQFEEAVFFFFDDMGMSVTTSFRGANMDIAIN
ncbi:MAG: hypothetical protein Roseis2KO_17020 [Roseivirga sp.]